VERVLADLDRLLEGQNVNHASNPGAAVNSTELGLAPEPLQSVAEAFKDFDQHLASKKNGDL